MENNKTRIPQAAKSLLQMYYHSSNIKAASNLRTSLCDHYDSDDVDAYVRGLYESCEQHALNPEMYDYAILDANINPITIMCSIIQDLTEYGDDDDWVMDIIAKALDFVPTREYALIYLEMDTEVGARFIDILRKIIDSITPRVNDMSADECEANCYSHMKLTLELLEEIHQRANEIHEVDPVYIEQIKDILFDNEAEYEVYEIWEQLHFRYNGATANHVIINIMDEYIAAGNYNGVYNVLLSGFEEIEHFDIPIFEAPIRAAKYAMTLPTSTLTTNLIVIVLGAIDDLLSSLECYGDRMDAIYCEKLEEELTGIKDQIIKYIEESSYQEIMDHISETKTGLADGSFDSDDDDFDYEDDED